MSMTTYVIQQTRETSYPHCKIQVRLLCREDGDMERFPAFFLCPVCHAVVEVG